MSSFYEDDLDGELTAIAIEPSDISKKLLSHLPLALSEAVALEK